jgi:hypothetical protein
LIRLGEETFLNYDIHISEKAEAVPKVEETAPTSQAAHSVA